MSVQNENVTGGDYAVTGRPAAGGVYAALFEKINLNPVSELSALDIWQDAQAMSDATADERITAGMQVFLECLTKSGSKVEKLDKNLIDQHIAELDYQISRQLDAVMHSEEFQAVESLWRGVKSLVDKTDFRQNVKVELLDMSKEDLRQDFEDSPEIIQSGLYKHTYIDEYDTPGGEPIAALISAYEFDASAQDVALLRNISKVSAAAHMPFIGSAGPAFFLKDSMEEVAAIKDIGNYFDRAEYIKWKSFRETDDARYIGLVMPRVLGRLPYGPDTVPVRSFNYVEEVKGPDHNKYLWTNASFAFAANMVRSFINNGWCVQIRGPQAGGAVQDLPIHLYDLGTGNQVKIPSEVMIPETREFEFASLGFIPLSYYKNRDYACFFSANSAQKPALYDTADTYAYLDNQGRYRVRLDFDRNSTEQGYACLWLRLAKPYAGDTYGFHSPLLDGTEVSVMFDGGDPDRPYIAHAQHDSEHPDHVTRDNHTRNIWRTAGDNKFRLEDKRQEEHFKLATPFGKTQLNGGHVVDSERELRGTGFELRTDEYGALRAGRGMFLSADAQPVAQGKMLDMAPAIERLNQSAAEMKRLNLLAQQAQALTCDLESQNRLLENRLKDLQSAVLLGSAPQGVAFTSGEHLQMTSKQNTILSAGQHLDMGAMKNITLAASESVGLFAHQSGAKLIANQGDVEIRAEASSMEMTSELLFTISSNKDELLISAPKLRLNGGGSSITLDNGGILEETPGDYLVKSAHYRSPMAGGSMDITPPRFSQTNTSVTPPKTRNIPSR